VVKVQSWFFIRQQLHLPVGTEAKNTEFRRSSAHCGLQCHTAELFFNGEDVPHA
jgi:hypothetical protein